jgi:hypothetical protein
LVELTPGLKDRTFREASWEKPFYHALREDSRQVVCVRHMSTFKNSDKNTKRFSDKFEAKTRIPV